MQLMFVFSSPTSHIIQQGSCGQEPVLGRDLFALGIIFCVDAQAGAVVGKQIVA